MRLLCCCSPCWKIATQGVGSMSQKDTLEQGLAHFSFGTTPGNAVCHCALVFWPLAGALPAGDQQLCGKLAGQRLGLGQLPAGVAR